MQAATPRGSESLRRPPIGGAMGETRIEIVGGIVMVALMKCRTKAAASRTEDVGRREGGRRCPSYLLRIPDRAEDQGRRFRSAGMLAILSFRASSVRPRGQERATEGELLRSVAIGEESEVANAMEAVG